MKSKLKLKLITGILILIFILLLIIKVLFFKSPNHSFDYQGENNISFDSQELNCGFSAAPEHFSVLGGAVIDIDSDNINEFFIGNTSGSKDCLFKFFPDSGFKNIIDEVGIKEKNASYGVVSLDFTDNGWVDLLIARDDGIYLYENNSGQFNSRLIYKHLDKRSFPSDVSISDFDQDGDLDLYVSTFIRGKYFVSASFNEPNNRQDNIFLENIGNFEFINSTIKTGLQLSQSTFYSTFIDLNNDNWEDLVVVTNTDTIKIYENLKNGTFKLAASPGGYGFWMGLAVTDFDQDGDLDLFLSNSGRTIPDFLVKGDLNSNQRLQTKYALWRNDGNFQFNNILPGISSNDLAFGWGIVPFDFNFDNRADFLIRQNYVNWPLFKSLRAPGSLLLNLNDELFEAINNTGLANSAYGFTSLVSDFNNDNLPDIVYLNAQGAHTIHLNKTETEVKNFIVDLPMSKNYFNAKVSVIFSDSTNIVKYLNRRQGTLTTQGSSLNFYYQNLNIYPTKVIINLNNGEQQIFDNISRLEKLTVKSLK